MNISTSLKESIKKTLTDKFPCYYIPRKKISDASNGLLNPRTMANEDSAGKGIANPVVIKGNVCYGIDEILDYMFENICTEKGGDHDQ